MGCDIKLTNLGNVQCSNIQLQRREYAFKNGKCYCDGQLLGIIKSIEGKKITVEHKNGSFSDGTISVFHIV